MMSRFSELTVGTPVNNQSAQIFPLFGANGNASDYILAFQAIARHLAFFRETSDAGNVSALVVENRSEKTILLIEGEHLIGAKQNRIVNTSLIVGAKSILEVPVSCVEQGRWSYRSHSLCPDGSHPCSKIRRALRKSVKQNLFRHGKYLSDQGEIWDSIENLHAAYGVNSPTGAMSDGHNAYVEKIDKFKDRLKYVDDAIGMAVAVEGRLLMLDVFDQPNTCHVFWDRLVSGLFFDAERAKNASEQMEKKDIQRLLEKTDEIEWQPAPPIGAGKKFTGDLSGTSVELLKLGDATIHASLITRA